MADELIFKDSGVDSPISITFFMVPSFSFMAFTSCLEPLRIANMILGKKAYTWQFASKDGDPVHASCGLPIPADCAINDLINPRNLVVCSGLGAHNYNDKFIFGSLRKLAREGNHVGAICTGTYILARAQLLNDYRCTIHWANIDSFCEEFPDLNMRAELFEKDRDRFTCAGGVAALDMVLQDIAGRHGQELAANVAEQIMHERIREGDDDQRLPLQARLRISHPKLIRAITEMEKHTEDPLLRSEIAQRVNLSRRQLERLFRRYLNTSPARYYLKLRLNRAKMLLSQTTMPITEVAFASGFTSASHFSKCYRDMFDLTPRAERSFGLPGAQSGDDIDDEIDIDSDDDHTLDDKNDAKSKYNSKAALA